MARLTTVAVEPSSEPGRSYQVTVGEGAADELARVVAVRAPEARRAAVVTDETVADQPWFPVIDPGIPSDVFAVPPGEEAKRLATVETLCGRLARAGLSRQDLVVAVGGGVVTDLAGFAASVYHRGIAYCTVATSLLGQVDAAIGGKTGVDLREGKNLVGAFWQPVGVLCDTALLATLPEREWACGRGEMAKYVFLGEPDLVDMTLDEQVATCVARKAAAVRADERETGDRALLNYGHTLAHAIEAVSLERGGDVRHGEAVAIGLVYAALLARRLGRIDDDRVALHRDVVERFGLSWSLPGGFGPIERKELLTYVARDKKADHDLTFVLDGARGLEVVHGVDPKVALATLDDLAALGERPCA